MSGQVKVNQVQLGDSSTAANNFVLQTNTDGTAKLARGNVGVTTQDILTVDAAGKVDLPQLVKSFGAAGSVELPGGFIVKWGPCTSNTTPVAVTFVSPFPTACYGVSLTFVNAASTTVYGCGVSNVTVNGFSSHNGSTLMSNFYIAIGR